MGVIEKLHRSAVRAEQKAVRLRLKGGIRRIQRAERLESKAETNRAILESWDDERWG